MIKVSDFSDMFSDIPQYVGNAEDAVGHGLLEGTKWTLKAPFRGAWWLTKETFEHPGRVAGAGAAGLGSLYLLGRHLKASDQAAALAPQALDRLSLPGSVKAMGALAAAGLGYSMLQHLKRKHEYYANQHNDNI